MAGLGFTAGSSGILGELANTVISEVLGGTNGIIYREAPTAARNMGVGTENYSFQMASAPKPSFLYMVKFVSPLNASTTRTGFDPSKQLSASTGFNFQAKSVDRPSVQMVTETVNQYNRKRIIYTGRTHNPINISFHDDIAGKLQRFWKSYFAHYFQDGTIADSSTLHWDIMANKINEANTGGFGLRTIPGTNEKYYFDTIVIYQFYGGYYTTITLFNPVISNFSYASQLSYEASSPVAEINVTFEYENVAYNMDPQRISASQATEFGFQLDYNNPPLGISSKSVATYLGSFLTSQGLSDLGISNNIASQFGQGNTTTAVIANNLLTSAITGTSPTNTSLAIKNGIMNFGLNAFSDLANSNVGFITPSGPQSNAASAFPPTGVTSTTSASQYSSQFGGIASTLMGTGLYNQLSTNVSSVDSSNFNASSLLLTDSSGNMQFTNKGLAGMNALTSPSTVFGVSSDSIDNISSEFTVSAIPSASDLKDMFS